MKLLSGECHRTLLKRRQYFAVTRTSVYTDLCRHMASLDHNDLIKIYTQEPNLFGEYSQNISPNGLREYIEPNLLTCLKFVLHLPI